jgi:hypothetical protein
MEPIAVVGTVVTLLAALARVQAGMRAADSS